jgi:E3 ubiquitin-protein ligase TRIP12
MDIDDSTMTDEDDEDTGLVVEGDPDAMGMSDEDDEELDDEDMDEHVAPATAIIDVRIAFHLHVSWLTAVQDQDGPAPGSPTDSEVAREDADTAAAIAAAAAAAAAEGDDEGLGSFAASLRAFPNILAGLSTRLKKLLTDLRNRDKSSVRLVALQDLSELLAMSNEETLAGCFSVDSFIKELINILKGPGMDQDAFEEGGVEMMLLACRCLGNLMEALPGSAHNVVHSGGVAVLCAKLLEIQFIDLAEQTLIVRTKPLIWKLRSSAARPSRRFRRRCRLTSSAREA